ncbi:hypothetical protein KDE12_01845 [Campylobacter sp. faydin G-105]|uniref:hypothetical protein n=1 Tax=Campylobacter anatolicus TaxID=2829105 RepID=UPI001B9A1F71|nr:hypothetical protein [Campylobacter anatolicus]MBR8461591.1 hypothetical protein [Campylobacter anatolicus]
MARKATLTFGMDLSDFNKAMAAINRQSKDLSQNLQNTIPQAIKAYKKGAIELKDSIKKPSAQS